MDVAVHGSLVVDGFARQMSIVCDETKLDAAMLFQFDAYELPVESVEFDGERVIVLTKHGRIEDQRNFIVGKPKTRKYTFGSVLLAADVIGARVTIEYDSGEVVGYRGVWAGTRPAVLVDGTPLTADPVAV